jgi:YYY domain-containing protein
VTFLEAAAIVLRWYGCTLIVALAAWPLVFLCLKRLPDRGVAFARMFGLIGAGYLFWLGCWLHVWPNTAGAVWLCVLLLFAAGSALNRLGGENPWPWLRAHWKEALFGEGVFAVLFLLFVWIRANNPQGDWAEKPMEIAFINSILRSTYFPPNDPWLSGYAISYYHFGYIMTAMISRIAGLIGDVGFNLAVAASFAMAGCGAFGILRDILILHAGGEKSPPEPAAAKPEGKTAWRNSSKAPRYLLASLLAPFCLLILGNLQGFLDVLYYHGVGWENGQGTFWRWLDLNWRLEKPVPQKELVPQTYLWWWQDSRVINDRTLDGEHVEVIDEFPAFSLVMGDLHPHVLALPFLMAVLAVILEVLLRGSRGWPEPGWERWSFIIFSAVSIGSLIFLNTWDVLIFGMAAVAGWVGWKISGRKLAFAGFSGWKAYLARWGLTGVLTVGFCVPFLIGFTSQAGGILPNVLWPTKGPQFFIMFGTLLIPIVAWVILELVYRRKELDGRRALSIAAAGLAVLVAGSLIMAFAIALDQDLLNRLGVVLGSFGPMDAMAIVLIRRFLDPLASLMPVFLIFAAMAVVLGWIRRRAPEESGSTVVEGPSGKRMSSVFIWILIFWGALLILFPEYFYLRDGFGSRMNTVFKFYFQGWAFWSVAAAFGTFRLLQTAMDRLERNNARWSYAVISSLLTVGVFFLGTIFLPMALWSKTNGYKPFSGRTLDASAYLQHGLPDDLEAIQWINANIHDTGPIAEAVGGEYSEFARISTHTGIPAVIGWPGHEGQWGRGYREIGNRPSDIAELYRTTNWNRAQEIIDKYGIRYVYFGPLEARTYGTRGLDKFRNHMKIIYNAGSVYIFERSGS